MNNGIKQAIKKLGTKRELARQLGIWPQAISQWKRIPHGRVLTVARLTGISPTILRPDLYPADK